MKNLFITFLLLFLVVQYVDAGSLLPSKVYAEDGYHCGKILDVQNVIEAEDSNILLTGSAVLVDSNFKFDKSYWHRQNEFLYRNLYIRKVFLHRAREGLRTNRIERGFYKE